MPMPFYGKEFTFSQPDGTPFTVKGWGNQFQAVFKTLDGFPVILNSATNFYEYAEITPNGKWLQPSGVIVGQGKPEAKEFPAELPPSQNLYGLSFKINQFQTKSQWQKRREGYRSSFRNALKFGGPLAKPPERETLGEYRGLCLLVDFPDVPGTIDPSEVKNFCNQKSYRGFGNNGSVFDYFYENSQRKLSYYNVISGYYRARHKRDYYTKSDQAFCVRARELLREALENLINKGFDFQQLSASEENYVYAINVFYAGNLDNKWSEGLWPHQSSLESPLELSPGRIANDYQITNMGHELSLGIFCHENGHMLCDFPDLYDYGNQSLGVGQYCLMCLGGAVAEKNPASISAYLKYKAGWAEKVTPISNASGIEATIAAGRNDFFLYQGPTSNEYFIIENRSQEGRDQSLPEAGIAVWHVDEMGKNDYEQMTSSDHYECSLEQADNRFDLEKKINLGGPGDLFHARSQAHFGSQSAPSSTWWDGSASGLEIFDISEAGPIMTFKTKGGAMSDKNSQTTDKSEELQKVEKEAAIAEAKKKIAEAEKDTALAQKEAAQTKVEREKLETNRDLEIAAARAELISKFFPKEQVKPLEGKVEMQDVGAVTRLTAYHTMSQIAKEIAPLLAAELTAGNKVMLVSQLDVAQRDQERVEITSQLTEYDKLLDRQLGANQAVFKAKPPSYGVAAMPPVATSLLTLGSMIPGLASLFGYFKTDYQIVGYEFDLDKEGFIAAVAGNLAATGKKVYRENFYTIKEVEGLPIMAKLIALNQKFVDLQTSQDRLTEELSTQGTSPQEREDLSKALKATQSLLEAVKNYVQAISAKGPGEESPKLVRAAMRDRMLTIDPSHLLHLTVIPKGAGQAITHRSIFRNPKFVTYLGGAAVSYILARVDGEIICADTVARLSTYTYRLPRAWTLWQSDTKPSPFWQP